MAKRLFWLSSGYVAGATSSWWVQRKVRRAAERVMPTAVRNEVTARVASAGSRVGERASQSPVAAQARRAWNQVKPAEIDLTTPTPPLSLVEGGLSDETSRPRLRERARRTRS